MATELLLVKVKKQCPSQLVDILLGGFFKCIRSESWFSSLVRFPVHSFHFATVSQITQLDFEGVREENVVRRNVTVSIARVMKLTEGMEHLLKDKSEI